jgi:hypothetical protein
MNGNLFSILAGVGVAGATLVAGVHLSGLVGGGQSVASPDVSPNIVYVEQPINEVTAGTPSPLPPLIIAITSPAAIPAVPVNPSSSATSSTGSTPAPIALPSGAPADEVGGTDDHEDGHEGGGESEGGGGGFDD